jgi:hypothetical protein
LGMISGSPGRCSSRNLAVFGGVVMPITLPPGARPALGQSRLPDLGQCVPE